MRKRKPFRRNPAACDGTPGIVRCHRCLLSHWDGIRFDGYGCACLQSSSRAGLARARTIARTTGELVAPSPSRCFACGDTPRRCAAYRRSVCSCGDWFAPESSNPDKRIKPCIVRDGARTMKSSKRLTELGTFTPKPARFALIGQTFLKPGKDGKTSMNRTRGTVSGEGVKARRPFVVVRISMRTKRIKDFHHWCNERGLVLCPLEFKPDELAELPTQFHDCGEGMDNTGKARPWPHLWEVVGPYLALVSLRSHRSVVSWHMPKRGVMPSPMGSGQSKK